MDPRGLLILVLIASLAHLGPEPGAWQVTASAETRVEHVCQSLDIRNHVQAFYSLTNCTVIEGYLRILLIDYAEASDYDDLTFPDLREITGFLLLYRVYGLRTLSHIFPNLSVIRGQQLFYNYGLVVFEMPNFEDLGLHSLTRIVRGAIRLEKNPDLCYVDTINWMEIASVKNEDNFIMQNKDVDECVNVCPSTATTDGHFPVMEVPMASGLKRSQPLCWNAQHWQKVCPRDCGSRACYTVNSRVHCCHGYCLGGCRGPDATDCDACANVFYKGRCLMKCPPGTYELMGRRCILEEECRNMTQGRSVGQDSWKLLHNKCVLGCPSGYIPSKNDKNKCEKCAGKCPKICDGMVIDNVAAAQKLKGCVVINGILEIQIRGGSHVGRELEENLGMIEEVTNYVKIVRSYAIISLRFLMQLRVIHGKQLYNDRYALFVLDNQNLQEVWDITKHPNLTIENGKVFFHYNRKLCLNKIEEFVRSVGLENVTDKNDVSRKSNGDQVACDISTLKLEVIHVAATFAFIHWDNFHTNDYRELLSWVVNYREAPEQNVTLFNARDACGSDMWKTDDVRPEIDENARFVGTILILKPYTQYALYVQTYTVATANTGAMSAITYLKTKPDIPTPAHDIRVHARLPGELHVTWKEPSQTNGNVTHYYIYWQPQALHLAKFDQRDYCKDRLRLRDRKQEVTRKTDTVPPPTYNEQCCECPKSKKEQRVEVEERQFQIKFENFLHDSVYFKSDLYTDALSILSLSANGTDGPVPKSNKRRSKFAVMQTNGTMEDLKKQLGGKKKSRIKWDFLPYNNSYSNLLDDYSLNMNMTHMNESDVEDDADKHPPYEAAVVYGKTEVILPNLHHFQEYSIEVIACHEYQEGMDEKLCSNRAVTTARTMPDKKADNIDQRNITVTNDTMEHQVWIRWPNPTTPNGLIVTYEIELIKVDESHYKPAIYCIKHLKYQQMGGYRTESVNPGNWSFRIRATSLAGNGSWTDIRYFYVPHLADGTTNVQLIIGIAVGVFFFLVILISVVVIIMKRSRFTPPSDAVISSNPDYWSEVYEPDEWEVVRENIKLLSELGQGSFGMVYEGTARNILEKAALVRVAVKTVNDNATANDRIQFLKEASVMKAFNCSHVVKLLGVVSKGQPTLVIMELMSNGDLKRFLQKHRPDSEDNDGRAPLRVSQILQWAGDIADGMAYLSFRKFVHRDLAARNCMVSENEVVKIGDFGMTRDIYETDYYRKGGKGLLPVRWMAPESLRDGKFDSHSDVWSYGVVLWEMVTLAEQPYQGLSNEDVLHFVIGSHVMDTPERCPEKIDKLMAMCWKFRPNNRPSFGQILEILNPDLSKSFRDVSYYFNEANQKHATSDADDDTLTDDAKTPLTTPHYVGTPMASSLQHHSSSMRGGSTSSHLLSDELDYQDENIVSGSSDGSSMLGRSPLTCLHSSPCECVPLTSFGGAARTSRTPGGNYWNAQVEPPCQFGQRSDSNSAIHSNGGTTENHISGSDILRGGNGHPRNGLANGHIPMSYYPSGANRV